MKQLFENMSPIDFYQELPSPSREYAISMFEANADPLQIANQLSKEPGEGLAIKGGETWPHNIFSRIGNEIHVLLCTDDPKYDTTRERLKGEGTTAANVIIYVASNAIASHAGMAVALCVPLVCVILAAIAKMGLSAWCTNPNLDSGAPSNSEEDQPPN